MTITNTPTPAQPDSAIPVYLWQVLADWSQATFGSDAVRGPRYPLLHLRKELDEAIAETYYRGVVSGDNPYLREEICDCFLLVLDAARRSGMTFQDLLDGSAVKLALNMTRTWGEPDENGVIEHDRS